MENALTMVGHSVIIGLVAYIIMVYLLTQLHNKALNRSVLIGSLACAYMIIYGHDFPSKDAINPNL
jgi:ABC-type phosphate transport system permease subunit